MQLPVDLVLLISDSFLDPISALALSLTCKDLFNILFVKPLPRLENSDQEAFLLLLEKDVSRQRPRYYCHACVRLHSFDPTREGPTTSDYGRALEYNDCRRRRACLDGSEFTIGYHHARLIMNQHFYGAPRGLALSAFDITYRPGDYPQQGLALSTFDINHWPGDYPPRWGQQWSARIIDDELFLSATHTLRFDGTEGDFRGMLDQRKYNICAHVGTKKHVDRRSREHAEKCHGYRQHLYDSRNQMLQRRGDAHLASPLWFNPPWSPSRTINSFRREGSASCLPQHRFLRQCRDLLGSCIFCATDYTTTLSRGNVVGEGPKGGREEWILTIVTYHELGSCRSPSDPKWEAFARGVMNDAEPRREALGSLPGGVKKKWEESV